MKRMHSLFNKKNFMRTSPLKFGSIFSKNYEELKI